VQVQRQRQRQRQQCSTTAAMCQKNAELRIQEGEPGRLSSISEVGGEWSIDTIGPFQPHEVGSTCIIAAVDGLSRFVM
jgi:hypothetical protein